MRPSARVLTTAAFALATVVACRARESSPQADAATSALSRASAECTSNAACAPAELCVFEPALCGKGKRSGACKDKPRTCDGAYSPVCGCDRKIYASECAARAAGVDLDVTGACRDLIADWVGCGARFCDARTSYCEIVLSDVFELPSDYVCKPLPPSCVASDSAEPTCDCFPKGTRCLSFCGPLSSATRKGFHLTCRL